MSHMSYVGRMIAATMTVFGTAAIFGCGGVGSEDSKDGVEETASASTAAMTRSGRCTYKTREEALFGPYVRYHAKARWDMKRRRLRVTLGSGDDMIVGPHNNIHASLIASGGGWVDTFNSPDNLELATTRSFTMKRTMVPQRGDHLDVDVVWDHGGIGRDGHCHIKLYR